jgi:lipopolysaccharide heptosyltransferase II
MDPTIIRAPNHLGDLVLALPALERAAADVLVRRPLAPLVRLALPAARVFELGPGPAGLLAASSRLRRGRYERGVLLTPSFSSALLFALAGIGHRRGTPGDFRAWLLTEAKPAGPVHRAAGYMALVTGEAASIPPAPRLALPPSLRERWSRTAAGAPAVAICPGSRAPARRWPVERFREVAVALAADGHRVAVFGGPDEAGLTRQVAAPPVEDWGGRTDLELLAAALAGCRLVLANDSGPMHLATAVGAPTLSLWGAGDPAETRPLGAGHQLLRRAELPCVPCRRNECPRTGPGTVLEDARLECMRLLEPGAVIERARRILQAAPRPLTPES